MVKVIHHPRELLNILTMTPLRQKPWLPDSAPPLLHFKNVSIIDTETGVLQRDAIVETSNGFITSVSLAGDIDPSDKAQVIDLEGKYLSPGLIDCHVHVSATPGGLTLRELFDAHPNTIAYRTTYVIKQMLLRGFTTARDTGGADAALRNAIEEGLLPGPRLFIAGKALSQTGGHGDNRAPYQDTDPKCCGGHQPGLSRVCDGVPECLAAARDELRKGANFLKIMCGGGVASLSDPLHMLQFTAEEIQAITKTAANLNTYVTAHTYTSKAIRHAVDNGVMGIEHGNFVDPETAKYCAAKGVVFTPTLITYHGMSIPPFDSFLDEAGRAKNKEVLASGVEALKICSEAGVMLCYGSDLLSGMHSLQNGEFSLRSKALSAADILRSATVNAAKLLRMEGKLGAIRKDAIADLLILDENPLEDITVLDRVSSTLLGIIKDGRVVASKIPDLQVDPLYNTLAL
jgi:imidazolonepropionase-like amidohydrolase